MLKTDTHTSATAGILRSNTGVLPDAESSLSGTGYSLLRKSALPSLNNTVGDALSSSYTLMDSKFALLSACAPDTSTSSGTAGDCCDVFKKLFAQESSQRKALDKRIESYKLKVSTLSTQLDSSYKQISELEETVNRLNREMRYSKGDTIDEMSRANCEVLEREVRSLLERLEIRKVIMS
jgi:septal ring factor EnvC (AmiA/AmiB activator)